MTERALQTLADILHKHFPTTKELGDYLNNYVWPRYRKPPGKRGRPRSLSNWRDKHGNYVTRRQFNRLPIGQSVWRFDETTQSWWSCTAELVGRRRYMPLDQNSAPPPFISVDNEA